VALQNAQSILLARQRAEEELQRAKIALEEKMQELAQQREWFQTTLSSIGDAVIVADEQGNVTFLNPVAEKLTGWRSGEASGQPMKKIFNIINEKTREPAVNPVAKVLREGIIVGLANHTALVSKDGVEISIEDSAAPIKDANGTIFGVVMVFHDVTERRRAEEAQLRLAAIVESSDDGIIGKTLSGIVTSWNQGAQRIFGYSAEEMIGQSITKIIPVERHAEEDFILGQLARGIRVEHYETVRVTKNGQRVHVSLTSSPIRDSAGEIIGASKIVRDIDAHKQAQETLRENEARLRAIFSQAAVGMAVADLDGRFLELNEKFQQILGYSAAELQHMTAADITHPDDLPPTRINMQRLLAGEIADYAHEKRYLRKDGAVMWSLTTVTLLKDAQSQPRRFIGIIEDITQRKQAETERARLAHVLEKSLNEIYIFDSDTLCFEYVNQGALLNLGYSLKDMRSMTPLHIKPAFTESSFREMIRPLLQGQLEKLMFHTIHRRFDQTDYPVEVHLQLVTHAERRVFVAVILDISERRQAEEERKRLLESERRARAEAERTNDLKDEFLANLSHELRTPLSAILGWSQVLRLRSAEDADLREGLDAIERNARMQTQLIEDLLDMNRITSGKVRLDIQPVEPMTFIEAALETVRPAANAKGIRLEKLLDPAAGPITGDPHRLQQVIWNLLTNAIKFTSKGGKVQIVLERVNSHIEIHVADTGIGIEPEFLAHVFERFRQADASTTRKYGGLGLGLSIVKHLVELHGGVVRVKSPGKDQGTIFTVHLPLTVIHHKPSNEERLHPKSPKAMALDFRAANLSGVKVLVVDDEADARELMKRVLMTCHAEVLTAGSAAEALRLVESERPQVLVSDIGMPEMDGYELLKHVRALGPERGGKIPAIALTAFARSEDRTRALRAGFLIHVSKPVEPSELIATIASVTGRTDVAE
ncbi:MAG: PAS domain S-box protein, partial [Gammaproteobacteria bacterium]|nr:PAS domain S-box protein [Gammaproteobacteria bacterium]